MQVNDLIKKSVKDMTDEELVEHLKSLKGMRVMTPPSAKSKKPKSNSDRQIDDLLSKLTPEKRKALMEMLKEE